MIQRYPPNGVKVVFIKALKTDEGEILCKFRVDEDTEGPDYYRKGETLWWTISNFDWSVPQQWYDAVLKKTKLNPAGHVVWCYDDDINGKHLIGGRPLAVTDVGRDILFKLG